MLLLTAADAGARHRAHQDRNAFIQASEAQLLSPNFSRAVLRNSIPDTSRAGSTGGSIQTGFRGEHRGAQAEDSLDPVEYRMSHMGTAGRLQLVIGVMTTPGATQLRQMARLTWMRNATAGALVRFVIGKHFGPTAAVSDNPIAVGARAKPAHLRCGKLTEGAQSASLATEVTNYSDLVFVDAPDCHKGYGAEKVHAWYSYAVKTWPRSSWIGKMEDDGMLWVSG